MIPTLSIGPAAIPTYPFLLLIAFWAGLWLAARQARQLGLDGDHVYNAGLYGLIAGIIGARLWFVLSHWENYASDILQAFSLSRSALAPAEGLIIAALVVLIYLQRNKVPLGTFFDAAAPGIAISIVIANIGAFLGGQNLGTASSVPWAVDIAGVAIHPVQLYNALAGLVILVGLLFVKHIPWPGFRFWLFVILYGVSRLILEIFVARPEMIAGGYLSTQIYSLLAIIVALAVMAYNFSKDKTLRNPDTV